VQRITYVPNRHASPVSPVAVPDVELIFAPGETKNVVNRVARQLLTNPDFIDATTKVNPNFVCAWCSKATLDDSFLDESTGDVRLIREDDGDPGSARLCLACFIAAAPEYEEAFRRKGLSEDLAMDISARRAMKSVSSIRHSAMSAPARRRPLSRKSGAELMSDATLEQGNALSPVGTGIAARPPVRSEHARFAHSAPLLGI